MSSPTAPTFRDGFIFEWAAAFQDAILQRVSQSLPELRDRWPIQGMRVEPYASGKWLVLVIHGRLERAVPSSPGQPLAAPSKLPEPDPVNFLAWDKEARIALGLDDAVLLALAPIPDDVEEKSCPRPSEQWDTWTEEQRNLWNASVNRGYYRGVALLARSALPPTEPQPSNEPIDSSTYQAHPSFDGPTNFDTPLWRYTSLSKYVSLLNAQALYFARADTLGDSWEGAYGRANADLAGNLYGDDAERILAQRAAMPEATYISCWHAQDAESAAMWSIYAGWGRLRHEGVAVRTTYRRLLESLAGEDKIYAGLVRYQDYRTSFVPEDNYFDRYLHKRSSFAYEHELRAVIARMNALELPEGILVPVSLRRLIAEVTVAPQAPSWFRQLVQSITERYELDVPVRQSSMDEEPIR